jgi:internalin A
MDAPPPTPAARIEEAVRTGATDLSLSGYGLTELPRGVTELYSLEELDLSDNLLTTLPPEIGDLVNLRQLYLDKNRLTALPPELSRLTNLRVPPIPPKARHIVDPRRP